MDHWPDRRKDHIDIENETLAIAALEAVDGRQGPARQGNAEEPPFPPIRYKRSATAFQ
jgi:hypothetical protein